MVLEHDEYTIPFGRNNYCGPTTLAYVMRTDPDAAAALLRDVSGKRKIVGTAYTWMLRALTQVGLQAETVMPLTNISNLGKRLTLRQWLAFAGPKADHEYIVTVTGHYLIVHGDRYFDNGCHLGKPIERCPYMNKTVVRAWRVTGKALVLAPKPKFSLAALRRDIERRFGVRIVVDSHECEVFPAQDHHSFEGTHSLVCADLNDAQARVSLPVPCPEDCDCRE